MGYLFIIVASIMYGIGPTFSALLQQEGWNQAAILFIGNSVGICILLILIRARKLSLKVRKNQLLPLLGLGGTRWRCCCRRR